ncbi:MAG: hypothetical protein IT536_07305 [Hyphomicrobiales bacterium]|nr:hypothetical protein [Hyphomicrobiales bacterium]
MSNPQADEDDKPLDPVAARLVTRVRWMMAISALTTLFAVIAVLGVVSYRLLRSEESAGVADVTAMLPKGARIVATALAEDRIAVTVDVKGSLEIRVFDLRSLRQTGRLRFATEP